MRFFSALDTIVHGGVQQPESYERKRNYTFGEELGSGAYGFVKKALCKSNRLKVAVKIIPKSRVKERFKMVQDEMKVLKHLSHPNIICLYDWFESRQYFLKNKVLLGIRIDWVCIRASGGELFDRLFERGKFTEKDAIKVMGSALRGIEYLYENNVVHRDIKPENLVFKTTDENSELAICDFGIAKIVDDDDTLDTVCGSPGYVAPEVFLTKKYSFPVDIWAFGVITYTVLCGYQPFRAENEAEMIDDIIHCRYEFHERYWKSISYDARAFIRKCLTLDPAKRYTATEALNDDWMMGKKATDFDLLGTVRQNFNARHTFKSAVNAVAVVNYMKSLSSVTAK